MGEAGRDFWRPSVQAPVQGSVTESRFLRAVPSQFLNISKDADTTTSLSNLFCCSVTVKAELRREWEETGALCARCLLIEMYEYRVKISCLWGMEKWRF